MSTRLRGLLLFIVFGGLFGLFAYWIANPKSYPFDYYPAGIGGALIIGMPGAAAIIGLLELTTGKPFYKLEESWANLKGWQRAIGGTLIVLVGGAVVFTVIAILV